MLIAMVNQLKVIYSNELIYYQFIFYLTFFFCFIEVPVVLGGSNGWPTDGSYVPPTSPPSLPPGPKPTVKPPPIQAIPPVIIDPIRPPYRPNPGGPIYTIEPPGFGNPPQVSTPRPVILPHPTTTTTTTWRPIVTHPTLPPVVTFPTRKYKSLF